jgi:two-component system nitrate/nitrite response regulator NarL
MSTIKVLLVDTSKLFREAVSILLGSGGIEIVAKAATATEAKSLAGQPCDLVLVDPGGAPERVREDIQGLRAALPGTRIVVLTEGLDIERIAAAYEAGADGYLLKEIAPAALEESLRLVMLGEKVFPTNLARLLTASQGQAAAGGAQVGGNRLSGRETQILGLLRAGESNKSIGLKLGITEATVKVHLKGLLRKLGVHNRTQAAVWAMNHDVFGSAVAV